MVKIQVQTNKVALEVAHQHNILAHWENDPCTMAMVFPNFISSDHTPPKAIDKATTL